MEKYSKQREEIINILKESYAHPTAEEVYLLAKEKNPSISRGTVYRNLNFLVEKGEIIKMYLSCLSLSILKLCDARNLSYEEGGNKDIHFH